MSHAQIPAAPTAADHAQAFASRPASLAWEELLIDDGAVSVWVWYKPPTLPDGLVIQVPDAAFHADSPNPLTARVLLQAAAVDLDTVARLSLEGVLYDGSHLPTAIDQAISPSPGIDPQIFVWIHGGEVETPAEAMAPGDFDPQAFEPIFQQIEIDWRTTRKLEERLRDMRKQLGAMLGRLSALNRDLTPDEGSRADRQDITDWRDARRWLRDCCSNLTRYIHEHDMGDISGAGRRRWLERLYEQCVATRQPFPGIEQARRDFESHRKLVENLEKRMQMTLAASVSEGERRAQQVLARIASKVRKAPGR